MSSDGVVVSLGWLPNQRWSCEEHDVVVRGLRMHYLDARLRDPGPGAAGKSLVMLHGMTSHGDAWRPVIAALTSVERVICPDFRGHGRTEWTTEGYWLADYADDVVALLDTIGVQDFGLVGQSLGARVSMVLAKRLGSRLKTMTLCDTGPEVARSQAERARSAFLSSKSVTAFNSRDELLDFLRAEQPDWDEISIEVRAASLYRENWVGKLVNRGDPDVGWLLGRAGLREREDMWEGLRVTPAATLVVRGRDSYLLDEELAQRMCDAARDATHVEMPFGHYIPYEAPEALAAVLDEFVGAHA